MNTCLNSTYVQVREENRISTGGSQTYFKDAAGRLSKYKQGNGCGIVAIADVFMYLMDKRGRSVRIKGDEYTKSFSSVHSYRDYFDAVSRMIKWIPSPFGVSNIFMAIAFTGLCIRYRLPYVAYWGMRRRQIFSNVTQMLDMDIPVILCLSYIINPFRRKKDGVNMYHPDTLNKYATVNSHFVTIVGIVTHHERTFYRVSSWGKLYDIDIEEYETYIKSVLFGWTLGNVLVIRPFGTDT